jgi:hypothetical protein
MSDPFADPFSFTTPIKAKDQKKVTTHNPSRPNIPHKFNPYEEKTNSNEDGLGGFVDLTEGAYTKKNNDDDSEIPLLEGLVLIILFSFYYFRFRNKPRKHKRKINFSFNFS